MSGDNLIGILDQKNYLNNSLQTFEKNVNNKLLKQNNYISITHDYRNPNSIDYPFKRTIQIRKTAKKIVEKSEKFDKIFIPTQSRLVFNPEKVDAEITVYVHDILPYTSAHIHEGSKALNYLVKSVQSFLWNSNYVENLEKVDKIICASNQTKRDIKKRTNFNGEIKTVYQGVDNLPSPNKYPDFNRDIDLLYVGTLHERKNPEMIKETFRKAKEKGFKVVSVNYQDIDIPGKTYTNISNGKLAELYSRSRYYLHLSDIEGFGRCPVEAQRYGCMPLALDRSINYEILGKGFYTVEKPDNVLNYLEKNDTSRYCFLYENSERYKWDKTVNQIRKVIEN